MSIITEKTQRDAMEKLEIRLVSSSGDGDGDDIFSVDQDTSLSL